MNSDNLEALAAVGGDQVDQNVFDHLESDVNQFDRNVTSCDQVVKIGVGCDQVNQNVMRCDLGRHRIRHREELFRLSV